MDIRYYKSNRGNPGYSLQKPHYDLYRRMNTSIDFNSQGLGVLKVNIRKQCLQTKKDHCEAILPTESLVLGLCTATELRIAAHTFGIHIHSTVAFSKGIISPGGSLETMQPFDPLLLGTVFRIPWHPRILNDPISPDVSHANSIFLIDSTIIPTMVNITADYLQEYKLSSQADTSLVQEYTIFLANTHFSSRQSGGASALGCRTAESFIRNEPDIPQDGIVDAAKAYHRMQ
ncbi:uncharacterized protein B0J16DRAFT_405898 [Fusarium flagelliforme]|uniref:uncharacterized protein n=1 Tax=Fusarium flagelliforme TaxID=2675880 RepID=UPI001E8E00E2|nr:uncharacterized protein B0J16DRAFT_405898 [Fusarium flagelliforme]KAH7173534.1 hypothetical protein B0J16DRAFT_405898 [Fusarium flagelliforme]